MRLYITLLTFLAPFFLLSQTHGIAYTTVGKGVATTFVTDYHTLGINSSALGWRPSYQKKRFTIGLTENSFSIMSPALSMNNIKSVFNGIKEGVTGKIEGLDFKQQAQAASDFAEAGLTINANFNWFGFSFQSDLLGGIAVSINENYDWFSQLSYNTSDVLFRGMNSSLFDSLLVVLDGDTTMIANTESLLHDSLDIVRGAMNEPLLISDLTNGTRIKMAWNRHFNIGYGRRVFKTEKFALYAGIGGRYIQSVGMFDFTSNDDGISAKAALSPYFGVDFGKGLNKNKDKGFLPETVGQGYGLDFSVSAIFFNFLKVAMAVNNVGSVTYKHDIYSIRDTLFQNYSGEGLDNTSIPRSIKRLSDNDGLFRYEGVGEMKVHNPSNFRLGASVAFFKDRIHFGADLVVPFTNKIPGSLENAVFAFGGDIRIVRFLQLSVGYYGGGIYAHSMPVGINVILRNGKYEFGISSRDFLSFVLKDGHSLSVAFGMFRVRF